MSDRQNDGIVYADKQPAVRRISSPTEQTFARAIDHLNVISAGRSVTPALNRNGDLPIDLSRLEFCECQRHESLLKVAFDSGIEIWLVCPYDTDGLDPEVAAEAGRNRPFIVEVSWTNQSADYRKHGLAETSLGAPLPQATDRVPRACIEPTTLAVFRTMVMAAPIGAGLDQPRVAAVVWATSEVATNSMQHGGRKGILRVCRADGALVIEIRRYGRCDRPLVDHELPATSAAASRGQWLAGQLCDLVPIRSNSPSTVVRLHMWC